MHSAAGAPTPTGFREHASGLIVPEAVSRAREIWTEAEGRLVERATKLLESRGVRVFFGCTDDHCKKAPIERVRNTDGSISLQCEHKTRVLQRQF